MKWQLAAIQFPLASMEKPGLHLQMLVASRAVLDLQLWQLLALTPLQVAHEEWHVAHRLFEFMKKVGLQTQVFPTKNALDLQVRHVFSDVAEQVLQAMLQPRQLPLASIGEPSGQVQVAAAWLKTRPGRQDEHPLGPLLIQSRHEGSQVKQVPKLLMAKFDPQTQAPLTKVAPNLHDRHPVGLPLLVRQVAQV